MRRWMMLGAFGAVLLAAPLAAQTGPQDGGRQPGQPGPRDDGPARQAPRTENPQEVNRGTDGSAAGHQLPGATGITPQGMLGTATAGERQPDAPIGGHPPQSSPPP